MKNSEKFKDVFGFGADGSRVIAVNATWWDSDFQIRKPKTNADRIRSMTDEELAEKLAIHVGCNKCPGWSVTCGEKCTEYWLKWLKQEIN